MNWNFMRHAFSSLAAVKQKAKESLERLGRGIACPAGQAGFTFQ